MKLWLSWNIRWYSSEKHNDDHEGNIKNNSKNFLEITVETFQNVFPEYTLTYLIDSDLCRSSLDPHTTFKLLQKPYFGKNFYKNYHRSFTKPGFMWTISWMRQHIIARIILRHRFNNIAWFIWGAYNYGTLTKTRTIALPWPWKTSELKKKQDYYLFNTKITYILHIFAAYFVERWTLHETWNHSISLCVFNFCPCMEWVKESHTSK